MTRKRTLLLLHWGAALALGASLGGSEAAIQYDTVGPGDAGGALAGKPLDAPPAVAADSSGAPLVSKAASRPATEDFNIDRLQRPPHEGIVPDLFALAAPAPAAPAAPPPPPKPVIPVETVKAPSPPPTAPPFPYTYVGGMQQEGVRRIFLAKGDDAYTVSEGDTLEGNYRITSITPERVTLTYLPLNIEQTVDLSVQDSK